MQQAHAHATARDHVEASLRLLEEEARGARSHYEEQAALFRKERADLQARVGELIKEAERGRGEREKQLSKYREKASSYKGRLRLALQNVQTLA